MSNYKFFYDNTINKYSKYLLTFSLLMIPLGLILGSFISNFFCLLAIITYLFLSFKNNLLYPWYNKAIYFLVFFFIYLLINSLLSVDYLYSFKKSIPYFLIIILPLSIYYVCNEFKPFYKMFLYLLTACLILVSAYGYFEYFFKMDIFLEPFSPYRDPHRLGMIFSGEQVVGSYIARLIPLYFALLIFNFDGNKKLPLVFIFLIISFEIVVYLSGERTSIFILIVSNLIFILLCKRWKKIRLAMLVITVITSTLFTLYDSNVKTRIIDHTISQMGLKNERIVIFSPIHESYFKTGLQLFELKPVFGHGVNTYRIQCSNDVLVPQGTCSSHPHNNYIQLLSETGIIGFLFLIAIFLYIFYSLIRHFFSILGSKRYLTDFQVCILAGYFSVLWPLMPSNNFFNSWITIMYFLPLGFLLLSFKHAKDEREKL